MSDRTHRYNVCIEWTGNTGMGTAGYRSYERSHVIRSDRALKPPIPGSSDPAFRGDATRWNPEELLVASLSACHKLVYLHCCADAGICVIEYVDHAEGVMVEDGSGSGRVVEVILKPAVKVAPGSNVQLALRLHDAAHADCFIANSVNFPVKHAPIITIAPRTTEVLSRSQQGDTEAL